MSSPSLLLPRWLEQIDQALSPELEASILLPLGPSLGVGSVCDLDGDDWRKFEDQTK